MFNILVDVNNRTDKHPEEQEIVNRGFSIQKVGLPVGDYCAETYKLKELREIYRREGFIQRKWHDGTGKYSMSKLDFAGTYTVCVDVKQDFDELEKNLLISKKGNRYRFERELQRAKNLGIKLYILVTDERYHSFADLKNFKNVVSRKSCGEQMLEKMAEYMEKYGCEFYLVSHEKLADAIIFWLSQEPLLSGLL